MKKALSRIAIHVYNLIPEGLIKHTIRVAGLSIRSTLPKRAYINPGDWVVQVGAPSRETVWYLMHLVGADGHVVVVEPEEENFERLANDERIASSINVTLIRKGAWSKAEILELTVSQSKFDHKIGVPGIIHDNDLVPDNYVGTQRIEADTLDNIIEDLKCPRVDFVELHVNGAEIEVLKGMARMLQNSIRVHVKAHAKVESTGEAIVDQIVAMLKEKGFRTKVAKTSVARSQAKGWGARAGDVYAAKWTG